MENSKLKLIENFDELNSIYEEPILYLSEHFEQLRNQVGCNQSGPLFFKKINLFEKECLTNQLSSEFEQIIINIESKFKEEINLEQENELNSLIYSTKKSILRNIFLNKSLIF
jgi:hypothetical protein